MAEPLPEVLYLAPSDPLRTPIPLYAQSYLMMLVKTPGITVSRLLGSDCPEELHGQAHGVAWVQRSARRFLDSRRVAGPQVLHVDLGRATQREFWAAQQVLRQRPGCALCLAFHNPPDLPDPVHPPAVNHRGGLAERLLGIGSFEYLFHRVANRMAQGAREGLERAFLERATGIFGFSRHAAGLLAQRYPGHVQKIGVLPSPLLGPAPPADIEANRREGTLPLRVTCFGRIEPGKAYEDLFRAIGSLHAKTSLVGLLELSVRGSMTPEARATGVMETIARSVSANRLGFLTDVRPGFLSETEVDRVLEDTDILVLPYRAGGCDSTSRVLLRAAGWGVTVVAADVGAVREMIRHGENGLLYPPGNFQALAQELDGLRADDQMRFRLANQMRKHAFATHAPGAVGPVLREVYDELTRAQRERRAVRLPDGVRYEPGADHA